MSGKWQRVFSKAMADNNEPLPASEMILELYDACVAAAIFIKINDPTAALVHLDRAIDTYEKQAEGELG